MVKFDVPRHKSTFRKELQEVIIKLKNLTSDFPLLNGFKLQEPQNEFLVMLISFALAVFSFLRSPALKSDVIKKECCILQNFVSKKSGAVIRKKIVVL